MLTLLRKRAGLVLVGLIAACAPLLMAPSGGIPSILNLQGLTVNSTAGRTCPSNGGSNTTSSCHTTTVSGHGNWAAVVSPQGGAGNELGLLVDTGATSNSTDVALRVSAGGATAINVTGAGFTTFAGKANVVSNNGNGPIRIANVLISMAAGGCSILNDPFAQVTSCSRSSAGVFVVTWNVAYSNTPNCFAQIQGGAALLSMSVNAAGTATVTERTAVGGAATDVSDSAYVTCIGS